MNRFCFLLIGLSTAMISQGQTIMHIGSGGSVYISANEILSMDGFVLVPGAAYTLQPATLTRGTTITQTANNPNSAIQRVYTFSAVQAGYSGTMRMYYLDSEISARPENMLTINNYGASGWTTVGTLSRDATDNFVQSSAVSSVSLNEITITSSNFALPVLWGNVEAERSGNKVRVSFTSIESALIHHFDVERKSASGAWLNAVNNISAINSSSAQTYIAYDLKAPAEKLFYRIKETDIDGKISFSKIVSVEAVINGNTTTVYPNPATGFFSVRSENDSPVSQVVLYNASGAEIKRWKAVQSSYTISDLPKGTYLVNIYLKNNEKIIRSLVK